jgi:hypothetical protein
MILITSPVIFSSGAVADERSHDGMGSMGQSSGMMMRGGGMDMDRAQDRIKSMQQVMDRIHKTNDPGKRRTLLREHMEDMQKLMGDMRGMMMGPSMKGGGMSMEDRQNLIGQRLDIMQQMMEQMMEQQSQMMK